MVSFADRYEAMKPSTKIRLVFITLVVIFTLILFLFALGYQANKNRIHDLQESRMVSCQDTYAAFPEVFEPFLPKPPLTTSQKNRLRIFYENVDTLIAGCKHQVSQSNVGGEP